mgnify:FL=1|tara:strand:- start:3148 stop:3957 length:810 start_codon:yes stop_codon:yes gene_type:complete
MKRLLLTVLFAQALTACRENELPVVSNAASEASLQNKPKDKPTLNLQAHIGRNTPFSLNDTIDQIKPYEAFIVFPNGEARPNGKRNFNDNAIQVGQQVADFTLYDIHGDSHNLEKTLLKGKATFIMTGSYTCPTFRIFAIKELNQLIKSYGNDLNFFVVYTVEGHPDIDPSPYSNRVWTTQQNFYDEILYRQPKTYGDRVTIVKELLLSRKINCPVLIDNPRNDFYYTYGEGPNRAYLISPTGVVQISQGWFNLAEMTVDIDAYLKAQE